MTFEPGRLSSVIAAPLRWRWTTDPARPHFLRRGELYFVAYSCYLGKLPANIMALNSQWLGLVPTCFHVVCMFRSSMLYRQLLCLCVALHMRSFSDGHSSPGYVHVLFLAHICDTASYISVMLLCVTHLLLFAVCTDTAKH